MTASQKQSRRDEFNRALPVMVRIPGEFGRMSAVLLSANELVRYHPKLFANLVGRISERAPVIAIVANAELVLDGREALEDAGVDRSRVHFLLHHLDSMWIRDFGPIFVRRSDGTAAVIDTFYASRGDVGARELDDRFPVVVANALNLPCMYVPISLEGGNLIHNGLGTGISSLGLMEQNRFRKFGNDEFMSLMSTYFALKTLTLVPPIPGESTGHADMFMTFPNQRTVVVAKAGPDEDPAVAAALERSAALVAEQRVDGERLKVYRIPLPPPKDGMWRSYTNVFYVNGLLLVPSYSDVDPKIEARVYETYRALLPDWEVVAVPADDLIETGGFLHCLTLGVPHFVDPTRLMELAD